MREKICIIGAGWFGCHIALTLKKLGYDVVLKDKNNGAFEEISGHNGRRLNSGIHYQKSFLTREGCKNGSLEFKKTYPELIVDKDSFYGYAEYDYDKEPSKVTKKHFLNVCKEYKNKNEYQCQEIDPKKSGFKNLSAGVKIKEASLISGEELAEKFKGYLEEAGVKTNYNFEVTKIEKQDNNKILVGNDQETEEFDHVINATGFMSLLPPLDKLPMEMEIVFQVCLALVYKNIKPGIPFDKFTIMDGFFPCWLPKNKNDEYILTHGRLTNSSYSTPNEAKEKLNSYTRNDEYIKYVQEECEKEIKKYCPSFTEFFQYLSCDGVVMPKIATGTEFRSAFACEEEERGIIHVFPGKVGDIFNIASEVKSLITNKNILRNGNYKYIKEGTLDKGMNEIQQKPQGEALARSTCGLKTYEEWEVNYKRRKVIPFAKYRDGGGSPTLFKKPGKRKRAPLDDNKTAPMPKQYLKQKC